MPRGIERINARKRQPNESIVFIKPLDGPDKDIAQDFLERVAAIMNPIMKENGLTVMSLEEFPPNMEFWGRNFNAGECIQLVLKHPLTHMWLSFEQVQYTMIHELAHIKQMNHSSAFWAVRNKYATHLQSLHIKGYTGEGFWSTGRSLSSTQPFLHHRPLAENELPQSLCGGTYRSPYRRQPAAPKRKITYAERQQRKKERKFGKGEGDKLGGDDLQRANLEGARDRRSLSKAPKIASSKRSRELRAAAALKRLEKSKSEEAKMEEEGEDESTASEWDEDSGWEYDAEDEKLAVDVGGGKRLVPVSATGGNATGDLEERNREWLELRGCATVGGYGGGVDSGGTNGKSDAKTRDNMASPSSAGGKMRGLDAFLVKKSLSPKATPHTIITIDDDEEPFHAKRDRDIRGTSEPTADTTNVQKRSSSSSVMTSQNSNGSFYNNRNKDAPLRIPDPVSTSSSLPPSMSTSGTHTCGACSTSNPPNTITCQVCANVLSPKKHPGSWKCRSGGDYWNSVDCGRCGGCGEAR